MTNAQREYEAHAYGEVETDGMRLKTAALYILSDWFGRSPGDIAKILGHSLAEDVSQLDSIDMVLANIDRHGRHNLRIEAKRG